MALHFSIRDQIIVVYGDTYRHRDAIKSLGGRFDKTFKTWLIPLSDSVLIEVQRLAGRSPDGEHSQVQHEQNVSQKSGKTVKELVEAVQSTITAAFPGPIWVIGEIENLTIRPQGIFLNLAEGKLIDAASVTLDGEFQSRRKISPAGSISIKSTIWPSALEYLRRLHGEDVVREVIQDGLQVRCLCRVAFYKDRAQLSLSIENIDPQYTKGSLAIAREALLKELREKGLDKRNKQLGLPDFPLKIGLVSAPGSRAESDFLHQLDAGKFPGTVLFAPAATQGDRVTIEVPAAMERLAKLGCDIIVITRGGGSAADLRWFDDRNVAYAVATCPVPVIAAIGHHDDTCIAEEISKCREKTPTAAAQLILTILQNTIRHLDSATQSLQNIMDRICENQNRWFDLLTSQLQTAALRALASLTADLSQIETRLAALDPKPWLERGWTRLSHDGILLDSVDRIESGMVLQAVLKDGSVKLVVDSVLKIKTQE